MNVHLSFCYNNIWYIEFETSDDKKVEQKKKKYQHFRTTPKPNKSVSFPYFCYFYIDGRVSVIRHCNNIDINFFGGKKNKSYYTLFVSGWLHEGISKYVLYIKYMCVKRPDSGSI